MTRIDKYLWCIRIFKSRTLAGDACDGSKVKLNGQKVKPSHHINPGDEIEVRQGFIRRTYRVKQLLERRLSAKLMNDFVEEITLPEEIDKMKTARFVSYQSKFKGVGRPTKKDRRLINKLISR